MWGGIGVASVLMAVLAALVVTVITLVNRIERQAGSIVDHLTAPGTGPGHCSTSSRHLIGYYRLEVGARRAAASLK